MKRLALLLIFAFMLIGCAEPDTTAEPTTLFGTLSARFQLGSTEQTISYKQIVEPYQITTKGEVLQNRGIDFNFNIAGLNEAINHEDLTLTMLVCANQNMEQSQALRWEEPNSCQQENVIVYELPTVYNASDGLFYTIENEFIYHEWGDWRGELLIENSATNEAATASFEVEVFEQRPPTTTMFELFNLLLPFVVIALFIGVIVLRKKSFVTPLSEVPT